MELYQLKYFSRTAKFGNISKAAQDLHVTQPSISKAIKALENELRVELIKREGNQTALTYEGSLLYARITPILNQLEEIPRELCKNTCTDTIRINVLSAALLVPEIIRQYRVSNPDVYFNILDRRELVGWDFCIRSTLPQKYFNNAIELIDEELFCALPSNSPLCDRERLTLEELSDENFIMLRPGGCIRSIADEKFKEMGFIPKLRYECDNYYILKRMLEEGLGVTIWPQYTWRKGQNENNFINKVCLRPLDIPDFYRTVYLITQKDLKMTQQMESFAQFVVEYFKAFH